MNFLVTYHSSNGRTFKRRTYTYVEAEHIASNARTNHFVDITISALNDTARLQMLAIEAFDTVIKDIFSTALK